MSDCGYNCPGCARCDGFGLAPARDDEAWGYVDSWGAMQPAEIEQFVNESLGVFEDAAGKFNELHGPTPPLDQPHGGGQPRAPEFSTLPPAARTPISIGDAAAMGAGGLLFGRLLAAVFGR